MRAAVVKDFAQPLEVTQVPRPEPGPGEVLIRVEASGLCHTDIHAARGDCVIGSIVGTRQDLAEVFALHASGRTRVVLEERPLDAVNQAIEDVLAARVDARVVLRP